MARAKKVVDSVEAAPVTEKKTRAARAKKEEVTEVVVETVEVVAVEKVEEVPAPVEEKVEEVVQEEQAPEVVEEVTPVAPVEAKDEVIEVTSTVVEATASDEDETVVPEGFRPVLRPTSVAGQPLGYIGCPKQVFDIVVRPGWRKGIEKHKYRTQLMSILYWYRKNGSASVRCNSSSKFAEVAH